MLIDGYQKTLLDIIDCQKSGFRWKLVVLILDYASDSRKEGILEVYSSRVLFCECIVHMTMDSVILLIILFCFSSSFFLADDEISLEDLRFLTRIHYRAGSDKLWGEHEIDYVLFMRKGVSLQPRTNEVKDCWYASQDQIRELLQKTSEDPKTLVTPWFKMIADHFLFTWWDSLNDLSRFENDKEIHRMPGIASI